MDHDKAESGEDVAVGGDIGGADEEREEAVVEVKEEVVQKKVGEEMVQKRVGEEKKVEEEDEVAAGHSVEDVFGAGLVGSGVAPGGGAARAGGGRLGRVGRGPRR